MKKQANNLFFVLALFACSFLFFNSAKASTTVTPLTVSDGYVTIPAHSSDSALVCDALCYYGCGADQMTLDSVNMTTIGGFGDGRYIFYKINPAQGARAIYTNSGLGQGVVRCSLLDGVNTASLVENTLASGQEWDVHQKNYPNAINGNIVIAFTSYRGSLVVSSTDSTLLNQLSIYRQYDRDYFGASAYKISSGSGLDQFTLNTVSGYSQYSDWYFVEFNALTEYCGDTICQTATENCGTCATDCGACSGWEDLQIIDAQSVQGLYFRFNEPGINYCRVGMSCKIGWNFDTGIFGKNATGSLYYYASSTADAVSLGTVNLNTQGSLGVFGVGNWVASSTDPSTDLSYISVVPHSDVYNQNYATTTTAIWFLSEQDFVTQFDDPWNASTTANIFGLDTYHLACTDEQWASTSSIPFLGVNVDHILCNSRKWLLDVGITPMQFIINKFTAARNSIMNMFPFNLITNIQKYWSDSVKSFSSLFKVNVALAADGDFSTSTGIYQGDFSLTSSNLFGAGTGTTTITFLSKNNLQDLFGVKGFDVFNVICRLLVWLAFFVYCWDLLVHRLHNEMTN